MLYLGFRLNVIFLMDEKIEIIELKGKKLSK